MFRKRNRRERAEGQAAAARSARAFGDSGRAPRLCGRRRVPKAALGPLSSLWKRQFLWVAQPLPRQGKLEEPANPIEQKDRCKGRRGDCKVRGIDRIHEVAACAPRSPTAVRALWSRAQILSLTPLQWPRRWDKRTQRVGRRGMEGRRADRRDGSCVSAAWGGSECARKFRTGAQHVHAARGGSVRRREGLRAGRDRDGAGPPGRGRDVGLRPEREGSLLESSGGARATWRPAMVREAGAVATSGDEARVP